MPRDSKHFGLVFDAEDITELQDGLVALHEELASEEPVEALPAFEGLTELEIDTCIAYAMERIPKYVKAAGFPPLSDSEFERLPGVLAGFLRQETSRPSINFATLKDQVEFGGLLVDVKDDDFFVTFDGEVEFWAEGGTIPIRSGQPDRTEQARLLYVAVDIIIEIFGLIFGLIGLGHAFTTIGRKGLLSVFGKLLKKGAFRRAFRRLLKGFKKKNPKAIFEFLEALEGMGALSEILVHIFGGLGAWDYAVTIGKFLVWLAAAATTGFASIILSLTNAALDLLGLFLKAKHVSHVASGSST